MKKIAFILLAFLSGTAFGQTTGTADINAQIVSPITIKDGTVLDFGSINAAGGGNVRVSTAGTRTFSNPEMEIISATTPTAATFGVTAANTFEYNIHIPSTSLKRVTGTETMNISFTHEITGETDGNATGTGNEETLFVGGLLTVGADQAPGQYEGQVTVTVAYQ